MVSWLECSTPDRVVRVRVLAEDIVLCSRLLVFRPPSTSTDCFDEEFSDAVISAMSLNKP